MKSKIIFIYLIILTVFASFNQVKCQSTETYIKADDPLIQYMGRIDFSNPKAPSYSFPGISIKAAFWGTSVKAVIKDLGSGTATTTNYYNVLIDEQIVKVLKVNSSDTLYFLATGLTNQVHTVEITKRTESSVGKSSFKGFVIDNSSLTALPEKPALKIEFIGDSWTCGYGNEISTNSPNTGFHSENEDNFRAWGSTVAKRFNAQYHCTAISGRGMYRNNTGTLNGVIPQEFDKIHPGNNSPAWNFNKYIPDLVVIHLGTNDFFQESLNPPVMLDSASYVNAYISFLETVRTKYANAKIVCAFGNSISDWYPSNMKRLTRWRNYINSVVKHFNDKGDNLVYKFELTIQSPPYGEDWHPTIATHNAMAKEISPFIETLTGVTSSSYLPNEGKITTSVFNNASKGSGIKIFPNPSDDFLKIEDLNYGGNETQWQLLNLNGEILREGNEKKISIKDLRNGSYILNVNGNAIQFIKQ